MNLSTKLILLTAGLLMSACTNPARLGGDSSGGAPVASTAPAVAPRSVDDPNSTAYFQQRIGDRVLFEVDQSTLTPVAQATLDQQAQWLGRNTSYQVLIEGHADEQGTREYNLALGARRADAVRNYLISGGVQGGRMRVVSYGKERPAELCSEESCYARNRRSVTKLDSGGGLS